MLILHPFIVQFVIGIIKVVLLLVAIAYFTIAERKIMAAIQRRRGPNVVGFWGLLQPLADGLKLIAKEMVVPSHANSRIFVLAPLVILTLGLQNWSIIPFGCIDVTDGTSNLAIVNQLYMNTAVIPSIFMLLLSCCVVALVYMQRSARFTRTASSMFPMLHVNITELDPVSDAHYGLLVILAFSSLTVYGLIIAGWASNSKYAFLGALRSAAQMISYEVSISLTVLPIILMAGSLNLTEIVVAQTRTVWFIFPLLPIAIVFFISMIAETNRTPFDLPEAEAELVAGYNVEYSSIIFAMFFLAEYGNMIMMAVLSALLFLGGWSAPAWIALPSAAVVALKALIFCFLFVLVRATFPRYRYDQLMDIGWKIFLPFTTGFLLLVVGVLISFAALPVVTELNAIPLTEGSHLDIFTSRS